MTVPPALASAILGAAVLLNGALAHAQAQPPRAPADADTPEIHLARGHDDLNNNRYQQAAAEFRAALALNPRLTVRARFPLAVTLFALQDRDEARKQFELIRSETGDDPNLGYYLGRLDLAEGNLDSAIRNLTLAVAHPPFPDTPYYLGYAYLKKRNFDSAEKWLKKAAELAPRDFRVHERLGLLYQAMGHKEEAEKAFARSTELHRGDVAANEQALACGHSLDAEPLEAARAACQVLFDPNDLGKLVTLGTLYGDHHDYEDALEPFRLAAGLDPDSYEMQYNLGLTYFRLKRYAESRRPLEQAVALRPDLFAVNAPLGAALYALGDDAAAYPVLDHAHSLNPQNADISRLLGQTALSLASGSLQKRDIARSRQYLLRAAGCLPGNPEPYRRLADLDDSTGAHEEAQRERQEAERLSSH
ncbi:MAG TPA: tetratricopeptide repeat protein [Terriglobia bacterium]|nr:tetratricopeptide repeat protein [Terriglobia bacterium]